LLKSSNRLINLNTRQLLVFLEISRLKSFAKAAERIPMSPSGVSMLVKELEEQVGARLFDRDTRSLTLTDAGRRLQPFAQRVVEELRALAMDIGDIDAAVQLRLDVAATPIVSTSLLPDVVRAFGAAHPQARVYLSDVDVTAVRRKVLEGETDIGLGFFIEPAAGLLREPVGGRLALDLLAEVARERGYPDIETMNDRSRHATGLTAFDAAIAAAEMRLAVAAREPRHG
jgi:DNA-binding transcriptional LysR family regulator